MRHDRDEFISINEDNIDPTKRNDFVKRLYGVAGDHPVGGVDTHHAPYDFDSAKKWKERVNLNSSWKVCRFLFLSHPGPIIVPLSD